MKAIFLNSKKLKKPVSSDTFVYFTVGSQFVDLIKQTPVINPVGGEMNCNANVKEGAKNL